MHVTASACSADLHVQQLQQACKQLRVQRPLTHWISNNVP